MYHEDPVASFFGVIFGLLLLVLCVFQYYWFYCIYRNSKRISESVNSIHLLALKMADAKHIPPAYNNQFSA